MLLALGGYATLRADELAAVVAATGGSAVLVLLGALVTGWASLVPPAIALAGAAYGLSLVVGVETIDSVAPAFAAGLLVVAELAYWTIERRTVEDAGELRLRRAVTVAAAGVASVFAAAVVLVVSDASIAGGLGLEIAGVAAATAALGLVAGLAWRHARDSG